MKLSILICTIADRLPMLTRLLDRLLPQRIEGEVEIHVSSDWGGMAIGEKRNQLMAMSTGRYVCFVDDDDMVPEDYVSRILEAMELNPDCIGFWIDRYVNGKFEARACHSLRYRRYATNDNEDLRVYERTPNHLNPIKREIAIQVPFPVKNHGEDTDFAQRIYPLLESEVFIDKAMYDYLYIDMGDRHEMTNAVRNDTGETPEQWFARQQGVAK